MDFVTIICILIWLWGSYKGWGMISNKDWEWLNRKEPLNYVGKGAVCILLGLIFVLKQLWNFVLKLISFMF